MVPFLRPLTGQVISQVPLLGKIVDECVRFFEAKTLFLASIVTEKEIINENPFGKRRSTFH